MEPTVTVKLQQVLRLPSRAALDRQPHAIVCLSARAGRDVWRSLPYGELLARRFRRTPGQEDRLLTTELPNPRGTRIGLCCIAEKATPFQRLSQARRLIAVHAAHNPGALALIVAGYTETAARTTAEALIAAALAAAAPLPSFKSRHPIVPKLRSLRLYGATAADGFRTTFAAAEGNALARSLSLLPGNRLTPRQYLARLRSLAKEQGWRMRVHDRNDLQRRGAGAFLAVTQADPGSDAGIVRLSYRPARTRRGAGRLALIGKGICYDTGGVNLKPARHMYGMHGDMQGSAVALGTLLALTRLQVDFAADCWLALAENAIGVKAYKPNDVVTALNGTTIEIVHTDAEGRMVLADTLALATRQRGVRLAIDYATLTGACVHALGNGYSGVFSNRDGYLPRLVEAGRASGERVWPFPLDEDYDRPLSSEVADVKQCALDGTADHILAARFLQRFVENGVPWIHVDLASATHRGGLAHVPTEVTGFGIRLSLQWLLNETWNEPQAVNDPDSMPFR